MTRNESHTYGSIAHTLCGEPYPKTLKLTVSWDNRHDAECQRCQVLVAIADANKLHPSTAAPSLRAAINKLLIQTAQREALELAAGKLKK